MNYGYENLSYYFKDKQSIDYTFSFVEKIINSKKVKSYIVLVPTIYDINLSQKQNYKDLYWYKKINSLSQKNNVKLIDLMDHINYEKRFTYFHSCDGHRSKEGNAFAADNFIKNKNKLNY